MKIDPAVEKGRLLHGPFRSCAGDDYGAFQIDGPCGEPLHMIVGPGDADPDIPWEHVSVSTRRRTPNWKEMCFAKDLFWDDEEVVMQLHPAKSNWINNHPYVLHLWRPVNEKIPLPPHIAV